jgi:site-specific DNA recombinase
MPVNRCAIYTRKSSDEGLGQDFNSLDAQREACAAYITSQRHESWELVAETYDDGGFSGGSLNRPAVQKLLADIQAGKLDTIVVYKIDRLTRSLADFAKMVELLDAHKVTFVAVTQQFNTTTSMGRLTLNVLLSFAQFEREVTGERIRDKIAASKAKGMWMGGHVPLGYDKSERTLTINPTEAKLVSLIYNRYLALNSIMGLRDELSLQGHRSKPRNEGAGKTFGIGQLTAILTNPLYIGEIHHKGQIYVGNHPAIISREIWDLVQLLRQQAKHIFRHRTRAKERSLLAGLLFDAEGRPMSPSHSNKLGKRYRYYVSQAVIQGKASQPTTLTKIPAGELETFIHQVVPNLLNDDERLMGILPTITAAGRHQASIVAKEWPDLPQTHRHQTIRDLFTKIELHSDHLVCTIKLIQLLKILGQNAETSEVITFQIPLKLKRVQGGVTYVLSNNPAPKAPNQTLIKAIAKARHWNHLLTSGQATSLESIAKQENVRSNYLRKLTPLAWLAPDIVEAILNGEEPVGLTLAQLHAVKTPDWQAQRRQLGFTN